VPIAEAELTDDDKVRVPLQKEQLKNAPKVDRRRAFPRVIIVAPSPPPA